MDKEEFELKEVKPSGKGWYFVSMFQFKKEDPDDPDYIRDWVESTGDSWDYGSYKNTCYVCFVHAKE